MRIPLTNPMWQNIVEKVINKMNALLQMEGICKSFSGMQVLDHVCFELFSGEVHALLGENGAGKSTLIKVLGGVYSRDSGEIFVNGEKAEITDVSSAGNYDISIIHQELMLAPDLSVAENIFMGHPILSRFRTVNMTEMEKQAQKLLEESGLAVRAEQLVGELNIAQRQMIEIVRAISFGAKIIVMDEPTSSLAEDEVETLFAAIRRLKERGVGIIYISHRMSELDAIADRVTVLRDGKYIATVSMAETTHEKLVSLMVGRDLESFYTKHANFTDEVILQVDHLVSGKTVKDVSFSLRKGEVLGFAGLIGAGRSEVMKCLFGLATQDGGTIYLDGRPIRIKNVKQAVSLGFGMVPEDRKNEGIFGVQGLRANTTVEVMDQFLKYGRYDAEKEYQLTKEYVDDVMAAKYSSLEQPISDLSGGNQQKIIFSRWLLSTKRILILDEPTRGIDITTKTEIYRLIDRLTKEGLSVILVSSELQELISMSDRIVVMSHGFSSGILDREEFSQEKIMTYATMEIDGKKERDS